MYPEPVYPLQFGNLGVTLVAAYPRSSVEVDEVLTANFLEKAGKGTDRPFLGCKCSLCGYV